jgi:hypothetical protein
LPDIGRNADTRRTVSQVLITQRTRPVGAIITVQGITNFTGINNNTRSESFLSLDIPVIIERVNINIRAARNFRKHVFFSGNDILEDADKFFESINDSLPVFSFIPFYSLFSSQLNDAMNKSLINSPSVNISNYTSFNDHYSIRVMLPNVFNLSAFIVPSRFSFRIERVLEERMDTRTDTLNIGSSVGFSAINMFGAMGYSPIFKFYQSDEYMHGIDAAFIIPKDENISWRVQSVLHAGFRGFTGGVLSFTNTLTIRSGANWLESFTAGWETPVKNSIIGVFYNWAVGAVERQGTWLNFSSLLNSNYEMLRRETIEIIFDKSQEHLRWSIVAGHEEIIRIIGRLNFSLFLKLKFSENLYTEIFTFDAQIGTALRISF